MTVSRHSLFYLFWGIGIVSYLALGSIYIFPSGVPQPSELILLAFFFIASLFLTITVSNGLSPVVPALLFVALVFVITFVWSIILSDLQMAVTPFYYLYNVCIFLLIYFAIALDAARAYRWITVAVTIGLASLVLQFLLVFDPSLRRQSLGFNNPNQLGYFALCLSCILVVLRVVGTISTVRHYVCLGIVGGFVILSFSGTAIAAYILVALYSVFRDSFGSVSRLVVVSIALVACSIGVIQFAVHNQYLATNALYRLERLEHKTQNVGEQRGYSRIWEYPEHTILGAAEGARHRWGPEHEHEIHSTLGTVVFSYGILGTGLFLLFLISVQAGARIPGVVLIIAPLLYGATHQGLRFTMFWVLLALIAGLRFRSGFGRARTL
jgi:hypothetical protein